MRFGIGIFDERFLEDCRGLLEAFQKPSWNGNVAYGVLEGSVYLRSEATYGQPERVSVDTSACGQ